MLEVIDINRSFGDLKAVQGVTFQVQPGRLTGFVGGNGAGKTTTMRIIMGVLIPDSGQIKFQGQLVTRAVDARFGYMPEERGLYPKMGVREQLVYFARLHGLDSAKAQTNADGLLERLGLTERAGDLVEKLSLGNQQRAQIAAALVHDPEVLILDEPFSGLDPMAVDAVMAVLKSFAQQGVPILFSSHQLDVVERITDDLVVISAGQIKAAGSTTALRTQHAGSRYRMVLPAAADAAWLATQPGLTVVTQNEVKLGETGAASAVEVVFDADGNTAQALLQTAVARGRVEAFERVIPPLSEVFKEVVA
jgi:ABC-2 type transport system ATP-binding protein